jgi:phage shock protein PspC (stress-responsive transcriptional regulator)
MNTRLYRSTTDRMLGGVCGGLGGYLALDPILLRLFFVLLTLAGGSGVLIYLLLWLLIPAGAPGELTAEPTRSGAEAFAERARSLGDDMRTSLQNGHPQAVLLIGAVLVVLGVLFLVENLHIGWLYWLNAGVLWPVLLIVGGAALIWRRTKGALS